MPTREEIAEWLRESGEHSANQFYSEHMQMATKKLWLDRAAQVKNMRCSTCESWSGHNLVCNDPRVKSEAILVRATNNFGCWHHKEKK